MAGKSVAWSPEEPGGPYLTLVARLPELAETLAGFRGELRQVAPREHHYRHEQLHATILNLDAIRGLPLDAVHDTVHETVTTGEGALEVTFHGAALSPHSVYLAGHASARLTTLRRNLRRGLRIAEPNGPPVADQLVFCNMMRFARARHYRELARWLRATTTPTLRIALTEAELVETDKVLSAERTHVLARFPCG